MSEKQIFTLKQVVSSIKKTIDERYKMAYWVKAEMHKLNRFPSGHCFPELVQKEDGKIVAQLSGTIWRTVMEKVNKQFIEVLKEPLKEGSNLLLFVKVTFSETYGLSLQILDIDPTFVLGELQREREETLKRLTKEGILNSNQQLKFPLLPKRIAIISADTSKGLSDFMNVLVNNEYGYRFYTHLFPAALQGDIAPESIQNQLRRIAQVKDYFDIVVIVRGGGGEVSMTCYNHYDLCRAIVTFPLPVLTGIGHSTNLTVAEMVAYQNGITPTELAEMIIRSFHEFAVPLEEAQKVVIRTAENVLLQANQQLNYAQKLFVTLVSSEFSKQQVALKETERNLVRSFRDWNTKKEKEISYQSERMVREAQFLIRNHQQKLTVAGEKLKPSADRTLKGLGDQLTRLAHNVELLSPQMVLKRGYSITRVNGKVISNGNQVKKGDKIVTFTHDFELESEITQLKNTEK
jgi:exodeoxyribonuclease VII large subunit